jgi:hypothetical protein
VEHPCYQCQATVEEGVAFCPHCGAPQIRVIGPEGDVQAPPPEAPQNVPSSPPQAPTGWGQSDTQYSPPAWMQSGTPYPPAPFAIRWDLAWKGALLSGIGAAILSAIPIVSVGCCLWMLGAGALSVALYQKQVPGTTITPGMGMRVGALAGFFGFLINAVVTTVSFVLFRSSNEFRRAMQEQMDKQMAANPDPKVREMVQRMLDWMSTPQGAATLVVVALVFVGAAFLVFTAAGGALGASMFGRRRELR